MSKIDDLMARGTELLGSDYAILCGAMSWVSERHLVSAISNAGGFGVIACGAMTPELLDAEIVATKALATRNFGVNLITMHPQLFELIEVCAKHEVGHVVLAGGLPPKGSLEAIKASGARVIMRLTCSRSMANTSSASRNIVVVSWRARWAPPSTPCSPSTCKAVASMGLPTSAPSPAHTDEMTNTQRAPTASVNGPATTIPNPSSAKFVLMITVKTRPRSSSGVARWTSSEL